MVKYYFFDGYNLLHANSALKQLLQKDLASARQELIEKVINFLGLEKNNKGFLVFDGPNEHYACEELSEQLQIYFGKTADQIIEKIAQTLTSDAEITLFSSDNALFQGILGRAKIIKRILAVDFWQAIAELPKNYSSHRFDYQPLLGNLNPKTFQDLDKLRR